MAEIKIKVKITRRLKIEYPKLWMELVNFLNTKKNIIASPGGWIIRANLREQSELAEIILDIELFVKDKTNGSARVMFKEKDWQLIIGKQ